jgi:hypothetical protein
MRLSEQKDSDLLNPNAPAGGGRRRTKYAVITLVVAIVVGATIGFVGGYFQRGSGPTMPDQATTTQVWSQWGMGIAYPAGLSPTLGAVSGSQADSASGTVQWKWNNGHTALELLWLNASGYNYTAGFQGIQTLIAKSTSDFTLVDHGNITMGSTTWQYETFRITQSGQTAYATYALNFLAPSGRIY